MPKRRFPRDKPEKSWKAIIDGWMHDRRIRRACMLFAGFTLAVVALVLLAFGAVFFLASAGTLGGIGAAAGKAAGTPSGWITAGGGVTVLGGGVAAARWLRRRKLKGARASG